MIKDLEYWASKCSDCLLHAEYQSLLSKLYDYELNQEIVDFLCDKATSKSYTCEVRFEHLKILLLNKTALTYDLKKFYYDSIKSCRRLWLKLFYTRGYAYYATEEELYPIMKKLQQQFEKNHDYIDYEYILSEAGLPYLVDKYKYKCVFDSLDKAKCEYEKIDPLLKGFFTLNENLTIVNLISHEETLNRTKQFTKTLKG